MIGSKICGGKRKDAGEVSYLFGFLIIFLGIRGTLTRDLRIRLAKNKEDKHNYTKN